MARLAGKAEQRWRERLARFARSGMTVAEFCEIEGFGVPAFYTWRKRLAEQPAPVFTEVVVTDAPPSTLEIHLGGTVSVRITGQVDPRQLRTVLECLEGRAC